MYLKDPSVSMADPGSDNKRKSDKTAYQLLLIANLKKEIEMALKLDPEKFAAEIRKIGFSCQKCGKCCKQACGDNRVLIIPSEIKKICKFMGLSKFDLVEPFVRGGLSPDELVRDKEKKVKIKVDKENCSDALLRDSEGIKESFSEIPESSQTYNKDKAPETNETFEFSELLLEDIDSEGNIHAFGWILRRKRNGDCIFLEENTNKCSAYSVRPMLCSTYPFYVENLSLQTCECEGLKRPISEKDSIQLAKFLLFRYISELKDTLALYEKFTDFEKDKIGLELAKKRLEKGICMYIVHDSAGSNKITY